MSDLTGALLASAQLLPFHSSRTRAYLVKGKGLLLSKLPRTTAPRGGFAQRNVPAVIQHGDPLTL